MRSRAKNCRFIIIVHRLTLSAATTPSFVFGPNSDECFDIAKIVVVLVNRILRSYPNFQAFGHSRCLHVCCAGIDSAWKAEAFRAPHWLDWTRPVHDGPPCLLWLMGSRNRSLTLTQAHAQVVSGVNTSFRQQVVSSRKCVRSHPKNIKRKHKKWSISDFSDFLNNP